MRLIFFGSGEFAVPALEALATKHEIAAVYSQPPRPAGRGKRLQQTPLAESAGRLGLDVRCPQDVNDPGLASEIAGFDARVGILVAYGALLPGAVLSAAERGFLNIHPSLLPRWRGAAPVQRAIMAGDQVTGVCVIQMDERFDNGPVLLRREVPIGGNECFTELSPRLAGIGAEMIVEVLSDPDSLQPVPQPAVGATPAPKITKQETQIDWTLPAIEVCWKIRGLARSPGAWTWFDGVRLKILAGRVVDAEGRPGEVIDGKLTVVCGSGAVQLLELQRPGKRIASAVEFLRGWPIGSGEVFGVPPDMVG